MKIFDSRVQEIKYQVLRELAKQTWKGNDAFEVFNEIANKIVVKGQPPMSCCIYKDRAIIADRIRVALGKCLGRKSTVQVVTIACDECPKSGHTVTDLCRGCMAHSCKENCPKDAIIIDENQHAHIDKSRCIECGKCASACRYKAITNLRRPCESACKANAITMNEDGDAVIIPEKCIVCGACVWECPFGAMLDRSSIVDVVKLLMEVERGESKVYAIVAPAIATQYPGASLEQVATGIRKLGFDSVVEVAMGADVVAINEAKELIEKKFLTSSCCPAFVEYIRVNFPELRSKVSESLSPMAVTGRMLKKVNPDIKVVFIGPCIAKKWDKTHGEAEKYIDYVITFEELQAIFDSKELKLDELDETPVQDASSFGRGFAITGGVTNAIKEALKELGNEDFEIKPVICNGIDECKAALMKAKVGKLDGNYIEGMVCEGGCVAGNASLLNKERAEKCIATYCNDATKSTIID